MNDSSLSTMALYFFGAILLSIVGIVALAWFIDVQRHRQRWILSLIFPIVICAIASNALLANRDVTYAEFELLAAAGVESPLLAWVQRLATALILALCAARLISVSQQNEVRNRDSKSLYLAFLFLFFTSVVLNNILGAHPAVDQRALYPLIIFTTIYFSRNKDKNYSVDATKISLLIFFLGCLAAAVLAPPIALQQNYASWLPGLHVRLWGLGSGPNSIGPLAVVFLLLLLYRPFSHRSLQLLAVLTSLAVLVLSQSKTAWISTAICLPILWWGRMMHPLYASSHESRYALRKLSAPLLVCLLGLLAVTAALLYNSYNDRIGMLVQDEEVATLTGRTYIWTIALETWAKHPLFGYGSSLWDSHFRQMIDMEYAYHAHNQILQTLSVSGLAGMAGLLLYLGFLFKYSLAANEETRGLSLALFAMLMTRSATETPFDLTGIFSGEFIMHLLLFRLVLVKSTQSRAVYYPRTGPQLGWG